MYSSTLSLPSELDGGEWSTPRLGRFTPGKDPVPIRGAENKLVLSINNTMTVRHVIRRRQAVGILTRMTYIVAECFGIT